MSVITYNTVEIMAFKTKFLMEKFRCQLSNVEMTSQCFRAFTRVGGQRYSYDRRLRRQRVKTPSFNIRGSWAPEVLLLNQNRRPPQSLTPSLLREGPWASVRKSHLSVMRGLEAGDPVSEMYWSQKQICVHLSRPRPPVVRIPSKATTYGYEAVLHLSGNWDHSLSNYWSS